MITHGDSMGIETLRRNLHDCLTDTELVPDGAAAVFDRLIGYYELYASSHKSLDRDTAFMKEAKNVAKMLMKAVTEMRKGRQPPGGDLESPRPTFLHGIDPSRDLDRFSEVAGGANHSNGVGIHPMAAAQRYG